MMADSAMFTKKEKWLKKQKVVEKVPSNKVVYNFLYDEVVA